VELLDEGLQQRWPADLVALVAEYVQPKQWQGPWPATEIRDIFIGQYHGTPVTYLTLQSDAHPKTEELLQFLQAWVTGPEREALGEPE